MFDNIGSKIKSLAKVICWAGIVCTSIAGFIMLVSGEDVISPLGLALMIVGPLSSWIGSFFVYGFGELIEKTTAIADYIGGEYDPDVNGTSCDKIALLEKWKQQGLISEDDYQERISKILGEERH